jgi:hypothetical protein
MHRKFLSKDKEGKKLLMRPDNIEVAGCEGMEWIQLAQYGQVEGSCKHRNEPLGSIKGREFLDQLADCQLPKKDSAA